MEEDSRGNYGKRPLWQWVLIYLVIGGIVSGVVYYFVLAKKDGYSSNTPQQYTQQNPIYSPSVSSSEQGTQSTVEYTPQGFVPKTITIKAGTTVIWVNKDTDAVLIASNPHPTHTDYPPLNDVGQIQPGQSKSFTFTKTGSFGYHNHLEPNNTGTVVVE